ncbi:hydroxyethylthiazole kinase [Yimella sp. cx-573]|nr:hydroxyethylthiazole kinase [Yimella sp. cx-573]
MSLPDLAAVLVEVRRRAPLTHCLIGAVTAPVVADGLLAAGGRPMMTSTIDEAPALVRSADSLLVDLAALNQETTTAIMPTVAAARYAGMPWVLDPAAIGVAPVRTPLAHNLIRLRPAAVRGNASEIRTLAGGIGGSRGADSTLDSRTVVDDARRLAASTNGVVVVSGMVDVVTDGDRVVQLAGGDALLARVTGTGCLLSGLVAACAAVASGFDAAVAAVAMMSSAAEMAARRSTGPGSFKVALIDALADLEPAALQTRMQTPTPVPVQR